MHSNVNSAVHQRVVNLFRKQSLSTDVCQRLRQDLVSSGLDDHYLQCTIFLQLWMKLLSSSAILKLQIEVMEHFEFVSGGVCLSECEWTATCADPYRRFLRLRRLAHHTTRHSTSRRDAVDNAKTLTDNSLTHRLHSLTRSLDPIFDT